MSWSWVLVLPAALLAWTHAVAAIGVAVQAADLNAPLGPWPGVVARIAREGSARALFELVAPLAWFSGPDRGPQGPERGPKGALPPWISPARGTPLDPGPGRAPQGPAMGDRSPHVAPVLLVPGSTWNRASLWFLRTYLARRGVPWVRAIDRVTRGGALAVEAEALSRQIARLRAESGAAQVDVVAFSSGGLVVAWLLRHHEGVAGSVRRLVTIGTPWRGTRMAVFATGRAMDEVRYGAPILDGLWPLPVPTTCVFSPADPVVVPARSAAPDHGAELVEIEDGGHAELLVSGRVYRAVLAALDRPNPVVPP